MEVKTFGVIGAGQMGSGIAQVAAASGLAVIMNDIKKEFVDRGLAGIAKNLQRTVDKGKLAGAEKDAILARIKPSSSLADMTPDQRRALPCIGRERSDLVVAGCAILETILDLWPADRLGVADRGIREGILRSLMSTEGAGERTRAALRRIKREGTK